MTVRKAGNSSRQKNHWEECVTSERFASRLIHLWFLWEIVRDRRFLNNTKPSVREPASSWLLWLLSAMIYLRYDQNLCPTSFYLPEQIRSFDHWYRRTFTWLVRAFTGEQRRKMDHPLWMKVVRPTSPNLQYFHKTSVCEVTFVICSQTASNEKRCAFWLFRRIFVSLLVSNLLFQLVQRV